MDRLARGLARIPGITLYKTGASCQQAAVLSLNLKGFEPGEACAVLDQAFDIKARAGLHCAPAAHKTFGTFPAGTIRLSPGYFNTTDEIDFTLDAFKKSL